jgi:uncharacterized protein (TIGR02058 family)
MGMGVDVHGRDATKAAKRAVSTRSAVPASVVAVNAANFFRKKETVR